MCNNLSMISLSFWKAILEEERWPSDKLIMLKLLHIKLVHIAIMMTS